MSIIRSVRPSLLVAALAASLVGCPGPTPAEPGWQLVADHLPEALLSIGGRSSTDVWAVGSDKGQGPLVLRHDGTGFRRVATGTRGDLWWVHVFSDGTALLGGVSSTILRWDGSTFTRMPTPGQSRHIIFGLWGESPDDAYAVGSIGGRNGFVWHWDGAAWTELLLPEDLPRDGNADNPGFFKVWGDGAGQVWVVGARGVVLRRQGEGAFERIESGVTDTLFTVAGAGDQLIAVGGGGTGTLVERQADGSFASRAPALSGLLQGISVQADGHAIATGFQGAVWERRSGTWAEAGGAGLEDVRFEADVASLHAAWIDPDGGVWAVGGGVLSPALDQGAILHRGVEVPRYTVTPALDGGVTDGGVTDGGPDAGPAPVMCPETAIDPAPAGSTIARRWNDQLLNAIRRDIPRPGVHARNLFHVSAAMWDAWAAYDTVADGVFYRTRESAADVEAAREEALSYAAYRVLAHRYTTAIGGATSAACFRAFMARLGLDPDDTSADGATPSAVGNRIGALVIEAHRDDGANEGMNYADTTMFTSVNPPLVVDEPGPGAIVDPARFQFLNLAVAATQNGIILPSGVQTYIGAQWGAVTPFAMSRPAPGAPYHDPGAAPALGPAMRDAVVDVLRRAAQLDPADGAMIDISPGAYGNNTLGTNDGTGHPENPVTSAPYAPNMVPRGDFVRVLAEFWADGPKSETPPGHWNTLANSVVDAPLFERRLGGTGPELPALEWDVKMYLALNGAVHDAAITAWEIKRVFTCSRPITLVRWMAAQGQSSDPAMPVYDPDGLPLVPGLIELITDESSAPGQRHERLRRYVGRLALFTWRGEPGDRSRELGGVGWIPASEWIPYQRRNFVTPAFPGFISGHSTFSRAAAEVLTDLTGSAYFPGGLGTFTAPQNAYLVFERGPSVEVRLEWATYQDAADQAGQSRIFGGIHISPDDFVGRRLGHDVGLSAAARARLFFDGSAVP